ncbi:hypothetical protein CFter6_1274 [Collimonas fungivorans]|uniref:Uncharacterized protein n=1 Tax=Collimonas fungivorans TaxID=158899 RepID=A0A127P861_9BURK|nr:hypothetical protein CFter6_1274 [Collimonas fungivorans]
MNCSSIEGAVAYHTGIAGILDLSIKNTVLPNEAHARTRTIKELADLDFIGFSPRISS